MQQHHQHHQETIATNNNKRPKHSTAAAAMPVTDSSSSAASLFPVEEIVQSPLPGYVAPSGISFSPDDRLVTFLFSPDATLHRRVFSLDLATGRQDLVFSPPDGGGLDESNLSAEEKLRRERSRERGLGVTRYEWRAARGPSERHSVMVPLPSGVKGGIFSLFPLTAVVKFTTLELNWKKDGSFVQIRHKHEMGHGHDAVLRVS